MEREKGKSLGGVVAPVWVPLLERNSDLRRSLMRQAMAVPMMLFVESVCVSESGDWEKSYRKAP